MASHAKRPANLISKIANYYGPIHILGSAESKQKIDRKKKPQQYHAKESRSKQIYSRATFISAFCCQTSLRAKRVQWVVFACPRKQNCATYIWKGNKAQTARFALDRKTKRWDWATGLHSASTQCRSESENERFNRTGRQSWWIT